MYSCLGLEAGALLALCTGAVAVVWCGGWMGVVGLSSALGQRGRYSSAFCILCRLYSCLGLEAGARPALCTGAVAVVGGWVCWA
jgi:hypothetical protein